MIWKKSKPTHFPRFKISELILNSSGTYEFLFTKSTAKMTVQDFRQYYFIYAVAYTKKKKRKMKILRLQVRDTTNIEV